jgi:hypothetical protein
MVYYKDHLLQLIGASWNYLDKQNPYILEYYEYASIRGSAIRYKCTALLSYKITHNAGVIGTIEDIKKYVNNNWYKLLSELPDEAIEKHSDKSEPIPNDILLELSKHAIKVK